PKRDAAPRATLYFEDLRIELVGGSGRRLAWKQTLLPLRDLVDKARRKRRGRPGILALGQSQRERLRPAIGMMPLDDHAHRSPPCRISGRGGDLAHFGAGNAEAKAIANEAEPIATHGDEAHIQKIVAAEGARVRAGGEAGQHRFLARPQQARRFELAAKLP